MGTVAEALGPDPMSPGPRAYCLDLRHREASGWSFELRISASLGLKMQQLTSLKVTLASEVDMEITSW